MASSRRALIVGVLLAVSMVAHATDGAAPEPSASPISREALAALMKHPTEPHFDPLRPMSGRWIRCTKNAKGSTQDRFSSSDHTHFTHTVSQASDDSCKTMLTHERSSYECELAGKEALTCQLIKKETRTGDASWSTVKISDADRADGTIKLSFVGVKKKKRSKSSKHHHKTSEASEAGTDAIGGAQAGKDQQLELRIAPSTGGETETIILDFVPGLPHTKKHIAEPEA